MDQATHNKIVSFIWGIDNHSMGTVFEELVRKFNEDNNEEAGEHWTPRDAVRLMANLVFRPIAKELKSGSYLLYDCACGTGGILTEGEETLLSLGGAQGLQITTNLYGQEINPETFAICKADMLLKGEGENANNIIGGAELSTLSHDAFPAMCFDFMMANPPYGKSRKKDLELLGDPRFRVMHDGEELSLVTRTSDGQMLFLANMVAKMQHDTPLGSRIAEVHNGSSLFTGDAGQGESNIRRWIRSLGIKFPAPDLKQILKAVSWRDENAPPVIGKVHKPGKSKPDPFHGRYEQKIGGKTCVVEYEPDSDLRDTEQVPLLEEGGIQAFIAREVLPYTPDARVKEGATKIGYEISFTRHFYKPQPLRTLEEIRADIIAAEQEAEGLLDELLH